MSNHQKHSNLVRSKKGVFSKFEIGLLGTNCEKIRKIALLISRSLKNDFNVSYLDADHKNEDNSSAKPLVFHEEIIDKISHFQLSLKYHKNLDLSYKNFINSHLTVINGNHYSSSNQIVIIDSVKKNSLIKRKDNLNNVIALIGLEGVIIPDYIKALIPGYSQLPLFLINNKQGISNFVKSYTESKTPILNGLILGGGYSKRMGTDKILLDYHGESQYHYLTKLMGSKCKEVFVSCREKQNFKFSNMIIDSFKDLGAYGGILSAFRFNPNSAWLTIACDIPLLNEDTVAFLIENRDPSKLATCFYNSKTKFPEPLITIWEPKAYPVLLNFLSLGYSCARKVLINSEIKLIKLNDQKLLINANTSIERGKAIAILNK